VLLQLEDYALLLGAVGLFVTLATVMWITRRVNWYALHE
jgi:inner membrane protein